MAESAHSGNKYTELSNGNKIPSLGFGTGGHRDAAGEEFIIEAIKIGYRHFDTAKAYKNEDTVGRAVKTAIAEGLVKREELFITTKLAAEDKGNEEAAVKESLAKLQLDYVDLYLIHWPIGEVDDATGKITKQVPLHVTWKNLEEQVRAGRVRSLGVSNFNVQLLLDLLSYAEIKPVVNQVEIHPFLSQEDLLRFSDLHGITLVAYSPLGGRKSSKVLLEDPVIKEIVANHNKTENQVVLAWHLSRGVVPIPKTTNKERLRQNFEVYQIQLTSEETEKINGLNKNLRFNDPSYTGHLGKISLFV